MSMNRQDEFKKQNVFKRLLPLALVAMALPAFSTSYYWSGGDGDWEDNTKWRTGSARTEIPDAYPSSAEGSELTGTPDFGSGTLQLRTVTEEGLVKLQGRFRPGALLIIR